MPGAGHGNLRVTATRGRSSSSHGVDADHSQHLGGEPREIRIDYHGIDRHIAEDP